ncbi:LysE/ArgO family amino acid transporter [Actinomycetota bacterium]
MTLSVFTVNHVALTGLLTGLSLIIAIGAQNAFVLRQGIRREHIGAVVAICALADMALIGVGTAGVGALLGAEPRLLALLKWGGVAYLTWFGINSLRAATQRHSLAEASPRSRGSVATTTLALTFLNPHVYLDTVLMLGNLANQYDGAKWTYAAGAMVGSVLWFTGLGFGATKLAKPLARPRTWQVIDIGVGITMLAIAAKLATM